MVSYNVLLKQFVQIFQSTILVACFAGFIFQVVEFISLYYQYQTSVEIKIEPADKLLLPSVTFCPRQTPELYIKCLMKPDECRQDSDFVQGIKPQNDSTQIQKTVDWKEASIQLDNVLVMCSYEWADNCNPIYTSIFPILGKCFTINSDWTLTSVTRNSSKMSRLRRVNGIYMHFYLYLDQNTSFVRRCSTCIALSPPDSVPDVLNGLYNLNNGAEYTFFIYQSISHLLPPPYATNCTDYGKMGRTPFRSGLLTQQTCFAECIANVTLEMCGCIYHNYPYLFDYPGSFRVCYEGKENGICNSQQLESERVNAEHYCNGICRVSCRKVTYEVSLSKQPIIVPGTVDEESTQQLYGNFLNKPVSLGSIKSSGIKVNIMFKSKHVMVYQHYPKYQDVELFSYIGGYVGMWLGISLANVLEAIIDCSIKIKNWYFNLKEQSSNIIEPIHQAVVAIDVIEK